MVGYSKKKEEPTTEEKGKKLGKKAIVISSVCALLVLATILSSVLIFGRMGDFDYLRSDLSKYISLSESDYKGFDVELGFFTDEEADTERKIMQLLYAHKSLNPVNKGADVLKVPVSLGDTVYIYYRGYTVDENGRQTELDSSSNMLDERYPLGIGSLTFIPGFEEKLIGALPLEHKLDVATDRFESGYVLRDDVIYLDYTAILPDGGTVNSKNERIDLSDPLTDLFFGEGFCEYFSSSNINIGSEISGEKTFSVSDGTAVYLDMKVNYAIRCKNEPLTVDVRFPFDYTEASLRGKEVKFDVYFSHTVDYDVPEYNSDFVTETLKISSDTLGGYKGADMAEKYRAFVLESVKKEYDTRCETLAEELIWDAFKEKAELIKLPEEEVSEVYEEIYYSLYSEYYTYFSAKFASFDDYVRYYYGADSKAIPGELLRKDAENTVFEKMLLYYIIREENLLPTEKEFSDSYEKIVGEHLDYYVEEIYSEELKNIQDEQKKKERIAEIKSEMMEFYGEEYFTEMVYYDFAYPTVMSFVNVIK